ncbi:MAG: AsmA family protein [Alphaproteobacteria bacterium]|nr:AsmA family protein [Alphaproteobacteria bacterium]
MALMEETFRDRMKARARAAAAATRARANAAWARRPVRIGAYVLAPIVLIVFLLTIADWNLLRGPVSGIASAALDRKVIIAGDLDVDLWSAHPRITAQKITVADPQWAGDGETISIERIHTRVEFWPALFGNFRIVELELDRPTFTFLREASGRATWQFRKKTPKRPINLPAIRSFRMNDGVLRIDDRRRKLVFDGKLQSVEMGEGKDRVFHLTGEGKFNGEPFVGEVTGASLEHVRRDEPYAFNARITAGATRAIATGAFDRPFDFAAYSVNLDATGPDLADIFYLTGLALPNTPPYHLKGALRRSAQQYVLNDISGTVGDTDLAGVIRVDRGGPRTLLDANLRSRELDFDDLAVVLGGPPSTATGETANAAQRAEVAQMRAQRRLMPDAKLDLARVRHMDAKLVYRAASVKTNYLPLQRFAIELALKDGVLIGDPVSFALPRGQINATVRIDAREDMPDTTADIRLSRARVEDFLARSEQADAIVGGLEARAQLRGRGLSVREVAANANGRATFIVPSGEIRSAFAELLGVNVTRGLGLLLTKDQGTTPVRCAVADFRAERGILRAQTFVIDTGVTLAHGTGTVSLRDETIDLRLKGEPKEPRLIRLMAPIKLGGWLGDPELGVDLSRAARQTGAAAAIGAVFAPLAAVLPFVSAGLAEDANCAALIAQGRGAAASAPARTENTPRQPARG